MTKELWHQGRVAIVTGGTAGIGLEIARTLVARGAKVAIGGRRNVEEYDSLSHEGFLIGQLNVCDSDSVRGFVDRVTAHYGKPDILVNSAGVSVHHEVCDHSDEDWNLVIETNLNGPFKMIRACLPSMLAGSWGRIVNIASTAANTAVSTHAAYCASKAAAAMMTSSLHLEYGCHGISSMGLSPGTVATQMQRDIKASGMNPVSELDWSDHVPPSWPAKAMVYMCENAKQFAGQELALRDPDLRKAIGVA